MTVLLAVAFSLGCATAPAAARQSAPDLAPDLPPPSPASPEPAASPRWAVEVHVESHLSFPIRARPLALAVDPVGGTIAVGQFAETADFGAGPLTATGDLDLFVASFDAAGTLRFAKAIGGPGNQFSRGVVVAPDRTIWIALRCDARQGEPPPPPCPFLVGLAPDGTERASFRAHEGRVGASHVARTSGGDLVVAGTYEEGAALRRGIALGPGKSWIARLDAHGRPRWTKTLAHAVSALDVGPDDEVVLGTSGEGSFGEGSPDAAGTGRGFVASVGADGRPRWIRAISPDTGRIASLSIDEHGEICVGGVADRPPDPTGRARALGDYDAVVLGLGADGTVRWSKTLGTDGLDAIYGVAAAEDGRCVVAGSNGGLIDLGNGYVRSPLRDRDREIDYPVGGLFVASFASSGEPRWARSEDGGTGWAIASLGPDHVVVLGHSSGGNGLPAGPWPPPIPEGLFLRRLAPGPEPSEGQPWSPMSTPPPPEEKLPER